MEDYRIGLIIVLMILIVIFAFMRIFYINHRTTYVIPEHTMKDISIKNTLNTDQLIHANEEPIEFEPSETKTLNLKSNSTLKHELHGATISDLVHDMYFITLDGIKSENFVNDFEFVNKSDINVIVSLRLDNSKRYPLAIIDAHQEHFFKDVPLNCIIEVTDEDYGRHPITEIHIMKKFNRMIFDGERLMI